jgi:hypothetical protein
MTATEDLVGAACASLATIAQHIRLLDARAYCEPVPELSGATIGQHVRHCLDHYVALAKGLAGERIDYDERARASDVECDRDCALALTDSLLVELLPALQSADLDGPVAVRTASTVLGKVPWCRSSIGRELQFVVSHSVHHAAMVATSCRIRGLPLVADHGVAPSTLRHRAALG